MIRTAFDPLAIASNAAWTLGAIPSANVDFNELRSLAEISEINESVSGQLR
jgi:hypothetical protein